MKFIDGQGTVFGRINLVDLLVIVCLLSLAPAFYYGSLMMNEAKEPLKEVISYATKLSCFNCGNAIWVRIDKGIPVQEFLALKPYEDICGKCGCKMVFKPKPEPILQFEESLSWSERYYKMILENKIKR